MGQPARCPGALPHDEFGSGARRAGKVVRVVGRDDRQFIVLPPGHAPLTGVPLAEDAGRVFPNVPYEEKKGVRRV